MELDGAPQVRKGGLKLPSGGPLTPHFLRQLLRAGHVARVEGGAKQRGFQPRVFATLSPGALAGDRAISLPRNCFLMQAQPPNSRAPS